MFSCEFSPINVSTEGVSMLKKTNRTFSIRFNRPKNLENLNIRLMCVIATISFSKAIYILHKKSNNEINQEYYTFLIYVSLQLRKLAFSTVAI